MQAYLESNHKRIGLVTIGENDGENINHTRYKSYIKILFLPAGYTITIDFEQFSTKNKGSLFFINANQYFSVDKIRCTARHGYLLQPGFLLCPDTR